MAESKSVTLEGLAMVRTTDMLSKERRRASHGPPDVLKYSDSDILIAILPVRPGPFRVNFSLHYLTALPVLPKPRPEMA